MNNLTMWFVVTLACSSVSLSAEPIRVTVLDFQDQTGMKSDALLGGAVSSAAMADKGVFLLGKLLAGKDGFSLVDRRDLLAQMERMRPSDMGEKSPVRAVWLHAAQLVRADAVLRGTLQSLSAGKQMINQGGYATEFAVVNLRVGLEALDANDGAILAATDGVAHESIRQSDAVKTLLSEDDLIVLMEKAVGDAIPKITAVLQKRAETQKQRAIAKLTVKTSADPALVELDGVLVGSTPLTQFEVYAGDHVLNISKPGYQMINKRILMAKDMQIDAPMFREKLTAEELKEIYDKSQLSVIQGASGVMIQPYIQPFVQPH